MRRGRFMKAPGPVDPPVGKPQQTGTRHSAWDRVEDIAPSHPIPKPQWTWGAAFLFGCFCIMATPARTPAAMVRYTQTFTNNAAGTAAATDLFVNYYISPTSPGITVTSFTPTNPAKATFGGYSVQYTLNGTVYASAFTLNFNPALAVGGSVTVNVTSDVALKNASYSWSYLGGKSGPLMTAAPTMVPEPASFQLAAIATGVGLVIGWNRFRRKHRRPRQEWR